MARVETLEEVLDRLFAERATEERTFRTLGERARYLGMTGSNFGRIRSGKLSFSQSMALRMAECFARSLAEQEEILKTLLQFVTKSPVPSAIADETNRMILDAFEAGNIEAVLEDIIEVYDWHGLTTTRLKTVLGCVRLQVEATMNLRHLL